MEDFFRYLKDFKDTLNLMLGAAFTLLGAVITWLLNRFTVSRQLQHDINVRESEAKNKILKDVYIDAFGSITKLFHDIELIEPGQIDFEKPFNAVKIEKHIDLNYNKIELVGSENTLKTFHHFILCSNEAKLDLNEMLMPFTKHKAKMYFGQVEIDSTKRSMEYFHKERMTLMEGEKPNETDVPGQKTNN